MLSRFLLSVIAKVVSLGIAFVTSVYAKEPQTKAIAYGIAAIVLVTAEYFAVYRPWKSLQESRKDLLDEFFKSFVQTARLGEQRAKIRVNLMLVRWCLTGRHFFQFYQNGMAGHPDANAHFSIDKGFSGQVFHSHEFKPHYIDLRNLTPQEKQEQFKLPQKTAERGSHVKAIVCVPLYRPVKPVRGNIEYEWIGVLNVDAIDDAGSELLKEPAIQEQIESFARFVLITLA